MTIVVGYGLGYIGEYRACSLSDTVPYYEVESCSNFIQIVGGVAIKVFQSGLNGLLVIRNS